MFIIIIIESKFQNLINNYNILVIIEQYNCQQILAAHIPVHPVQKEKAGLTAHIGPNGMFHP